MSESSHLTFLRAFLVISIIGAALVGSFVLSCAMRLHRDESLFGAAQEGNVAEMRRLIEAGADVNARFDGWDPVLLAAIRSGNVEAVRLLLENGADPNIHDGSEHRKTATRRSKEFPEIRKLLIEAGGHD